LGTTPVSAAVASAAFASAALASLPASAAPASGRAVHALVAVLHTSAAGQSRSVLHSSHRPAFGPEVAQTIDRHTLAPLELVHEPSPFLYPHPLSVVSHTPATHARAATVVEQVPPGTGWPFGTFAWHTPWPARSLHHRPAPQSPSVLHPVAHAPLALLQRGPAWVPVVQSAFVRHVVHAPLAAQYGLVGVGHMAVAVVALSPLQAKQAFVVVLHVGVGAAQSASLAQAMHLPAFAPEPTQAPAMHCVVTVHVPSPSFTPHTLPFESQAPVMHTRIPFAGEHNPATGKSLGSGWPLASFGRQAPRAVHQADVPQSASTPQSTCVESVDVLLAELGSPVVALIVAVAVAAPLSAGAVKPTTMGALAPEASVARVHVTRSAAEAHVQPVAVIAPTTAPAGRSRVAVTVDASAGPAFETARV
jgi:hypothetical protein